MPDEAKQEDHCCKMRAKFVIGIVAVDTTLPEPIDIVDFLNFEHKSPNGHPVLYTAFCAWCGVKLPRVRRRMIDLAKDDEGEGEQWKAGTAD